MDPRDLLQTIYSRGVSIRLQGDSLICKPGRLVKDLADEIRKYKPMIVEALLDQKQTNEDRGLTDSLVENIKGGGAYARLFPQVKRYLERTLPAVMVAEIEAAYRSVGGGAIH